MLKIWGRLTSVNVQKVMLAVRELALPHTFIEAGGPFGVVDTPEYAKINPNRTVPAIDDGGFVLWESNAIVRYLAARYGAGTLWPEDVCLRADADRWMDWQTTEWQGAMVPAFLGLIRTPKPSATTPPSTCRSSAATPARRFWTKRCKAASSSPAAT